MKQTWTSHAFADIYVMEALEAIRKRPHMYLGDLDADAPNRLLVEGLCLALRGGCHGLSRHVTIDLLANGRAAIESDLPWPNDVYQKLSARAKREVRKPEVILTTLYACRDLEEYSDAKFCTNGIVTLNALSSTLRFENYVEGRRWLVTFFQGTCVDIYEPHEETDRTGSHLVFQLDAKILPFVEFDADGILSRLNPLIPDGLEVTVRDNVNGATYTSGAP